MHYCLLLLLMASAALAQPNLPLEFDKNPGWEARPSYQSDPAAKPDIVAADGAVTFRVTEPGRGMKFQLDLSPFPSNAAAYLLLRYRAQNVGPGYALWAYDASRGGLQILNTGEYVQDGQWHVVAVDLVAAGVTGNVRALVTEVRCQNEPAEVAFDYLRLSDELPKGAQVSPKNRPPDKELRLRGADLSNPTPQPKWLANPATEFAATVQDGYLRLTSEASRGMKWSVQPPQPVHLADYRFVSIRYRATNVTPYGDYFVWFGSGAGGMPDEFFSAASLTALQADGRWHILTTPMSAKFSVAEIALQAQSTEQPAVLELDYIHFSTRQPLVKPTEILDIAAAPTLSTLKPVALTGPGLVRAQSRIRVLGLSEWLPAGKFAVDGIPFEISKDELNALATPPGVTEDLSLPLTGKASELYLLLGGSLPTLQRLDETPVQIQRFSNPERFVCLVDYADGSTDEVFPVAMAGREYEVRHGLGTYCLTGLRQAPLKALRLRNRMSTGSFLLGGVTLNTGKALTATPELLGLPASPPVGKTAFMAPAITPLRDGYVIRNGAIQLNLRTDRGLTVRSLRPTGLITDPMIDPGPLFEIGVEGKLLTSDQVTVGPGVVDGKTLTLPVDGSAQGVPLKGELVLTLADDGGIGMQLHLVNAGSAPITPTVNFPTLRNIRLGEINDTWYLYARKGGIISNQPTHQRRAYGGEHPLQVTDVFNPQAGWGLALLTYDLDNLYRFCDFTKDNSGVTWRMEYWQREYQPGEKIETAPTALCAHQGDWRTALAMYKQWAHSWYKPRMPRKEWFQKVFYYQQTNAWSELYDRETGKWRMAETIKRYRDFMGCLDYLHIFDFGESRVYGRVGDYNHYEELGGLETMRAAIKEAQDAGVPIGLYIEGYLCDDRGVWGKQNVPLADIRMKDGKPLLWEGAPNEHMMCPASKVWRDHLAETYKRVTGELKPNGMYIDQYGFINTWKTCWSREHGHPVPWAPITGERDTTRAIREAMPQDMANLTEETPNDVNSQEQDGGLGYSVWDADEKYMPHRVDLFRFMFPDFKVFQLTQYHPFDNGDWDKLKFPFFNGEGYWLGGGPSAYSEDAHQFMRKALAILNKYENAFTSDDVEPLIQTLRPTLYANRFTARRETVYTLFNGEYRTFRGEALQVKREAGARYLDAFTGQELKPRVQGQRAYLPVTLGPQAVGCIVVTR